MPLLPCGMGFALKDLYGIDISHQSIANYCKSAAMCIKPFVDNYGYGIGKVFTADETYIKIHGIKAYIWFIMDAAGRSIIGYQVSDNRGPYKQMIERLNRTYKVSYRPINGFDNIDGASYDLALWVAYYNFLRPHKHNNYKVLNDVELLKGVGNMPGKWQLLIFLGQQTILTIQNQATA